MKVMTERGAALIEYGMLTGLIAVIAIAAVAQTGKEISGVFSTSVAQLAGAGEPTSAPVVPSDPPGPPGEPTGPAASTFTITPGVNADPSHRGFHAFGAGVGSLDTYSGPYPYLQQLTLYNGNTFILRVGGNFVDAFAGHTLSCEDGLSLSFADAFDLLHESGDRTYAAWNADGNPDAYLLEGVPVDCRISDS